MLTDHSSMLGSWLVERSVIFARRFVACTPIHLSYNTMLLGEIQKRWIFTDTASQDFHKGTARCEIVGRSGNVPSYRRAVLGLGNLRGAVVMKKNVPDRSRCHCPQK